MVCLLAYLLTCLLTYLLAACLLVKRSWVRLELARWVKVGELDEVGEVSAIMCAAVSRERDNGVYDDGDGMV